MWYERYLNRSTLKHIVQIPWLVLSCGAWAVLAFIRGQRLRYHEWKLRRLKAQREHYKTLAGDE